jgi:parallel beta-helix repeat protein
VIGADGVEINLAGHAMSGGIGSGGGGPTGIDNTGGYDDVTVRNGTVGGFGFGVVTNGASRNRILNVDAGAAGNAVTIAGGADNEVRHSELFGRSFGLRSTGSGRLIVADTSSAGAFGSGIEVSGNDARIVRNRTVTGGVSTSNISGIRLFGSAGRVANNHVQGPWPAGGIAIAGPNNTVVDNTVLEAAPLFATGMDSDGDGIFVFAGSSGTLLRGNRADQNAGDGIDVNSAGVRLGDNAAFNNDGWGIIAVSGVVDLGGNSAGGNGAGQCQNVFCL